LLRPDLYAEQAATDLDEVDVARVQEYTLLSALLARAPDAALLARLGTLRGDASQLGLAHAALSDAAGRVNVEQVEREYFELFIGLGRGELLPYGSYYLTGFLHERPLARLRADLSGLGIERAAGQAEPEDHAAILCEIMAGLVSRRFLLPPPPSANCSSSICAGLGASSRTPEQRRRRRLHRRVGTLGRVFVEIEIDASRCRSDRRQRSRNGEQREVMAMKNKAKRLRTKTGKPLVDASSFAPLGAGAILLRPPPVDRSPSEANADTETNDEKRKSATARPRR
jgi:TorA maturation chaperone TorD